MKRREFTGLSLLTLGALASSAASAVIGNKKTLVTAPVPTSNETNNYFYVTLTTTFPYLMTAEKYKELSRTFRDDSYNDGRLEDMKTEKKLLRMVALLENDKVTTCYEFCNEAAWKEYVQIYDQNKSNSGEKKKQLGFHTKKEFKKSSIMV